MSGARAGNSAVSVQADAQLALRTMLADAATPALAVPDVLTAIAAFKPPDGALVMRAQLAAPDVIVRATAAGQLGELPPDEENTGALAVALPVALRDEMNDAALAILDALAKQKSEAAVAAIKTALDSPDYLLRRRAAAILEAAQPDAAKPDEGRIETVATRNRPPDYRRALARRLVRVVATVTTDKGVFKLELLPNDAPLTVDNFVELARRGFFNNISFHRVVPNFVVQGGDPRGDGNGGPGYQIRCEINEVPLCARRGRDGAVGQRHGRLAVVHHAFAAAAPGRRLHRLRARRRRHGRRLTASRAATASEHQRRGDEADNSFRRRIVCEQEFHHEGTRDTKETRAGISFVSWCLRDRNLAST